MNPKIYTIYKTYFEQHIDHMNSCYLSIEQTDKVSYDREYRKNNH